MRKSAALVALIAVLWLVLPAAPATAATHSVAMRQYAYSPTAMTVNVGDTIRWTNYDTAQHDVMITNGPTSFHGPLIGKGQSWTYTFGTAGTYSYICSIHPDMKAQIVVRPKAVATTAAPAPAQQQPRPSASASAAASAAAPVVVAPSPSMSMPAATTPVSDSSGLSPLLIVAGISVAVVVFCLLLMSSRPAPVPVAAAPPPPPPAHRASELEDTAVLPEVVKSE
jgi:plastocyanin